MEDLKALTECAECTWDYIDRLRMELSAVCCLQGAGRSQKGTARSQVGTGCYAKRTVLQVRKIPGGPQRGV